jgi:hypothetical protein
MFVKDSVMEKWEPLLENENIPSIKDQYRKGVTAQLLENQEGELARANQASFGELNEAAPVNTTGSSVAGYDPIMISMVRRAMPNLIAYDICGVQPMNGPTGMIFAMRPTYVANGARAGEAFYNEPNSAYTGAATPVQAGTSPSVLNDATPGTYTTGKGMTTSAGEVLGVDTEWPEMGFEIEKVMVEAKTRALKASYSIELAQDLKQLHGMNAETELATILSAEILAEINREIVRTVYTIAKVGAENTVVPGTFDVLADTDGRWLVERLKSFMLAIDFESNKIARDTRRGRGNVIICSSDVASALAAAGLLDTGAALRGGYALEVDDSGNTFAGILNGRYKVFIDPYHIGDNYLVLGFKGSNAFEAGMFYAPYVPLQMFKALDDVTFQPKLGFKTRYGMVANPYAGGATKGAGALTANSNVYYRRMKVTNLNVNA